MPIEKVSEVFEGAKRVGEVFLCRTLGWKDTGAELRRDAIRIFEKDGCSDLWIDTKNVPKLEALLKLWKLKSDGFAAYVRDGYMYVGLVGYYYCKPCAKKSTYIDMRKKPKPRDIKAKKIRRPAVENVEGVVLQRIYDVVVSREKVGEIYRISSKLTAEIKRFHVLVGRPSTQYGSADTVHGGRLSFYPSKIFHIRAWEVGDLLEIIQLWKKRRGEYPRVGVGGPS